jgi:hypothetical protein
MTDPDASSGGVSRRLNVTHLVAAGVLIASVVAQWTVSRVSIASVQLVSPKAGWELAPIVVAVAALLCLLVYADTRVEPVRALVRVIGMQALLLAGVVMVGLELLVAVLGIVWDTGSGSLRAGAGVWMAAIAGLLLLAVGDRDPLSRLLPGGQDTESAAARVVLAATWFTAVASVIWWTGWRNGKFAEVGPVVVVASAVPIVGAMSLVAVVCCWVGLAVALAGQRLAAGILTGLGCLLLVCTVLVTSFLAWAVDVLPVDELLATAQERAIEWTESVEIPAAVPDAVEAGLVPAIESAEVVVTAPSGMMWLLVLVASVSLAVATALSRRRAGHEGRLRGGRTASGGGSSSMAPPPPGRATTSGPRRL